MILFLHILFSLLNIKNNTLLQTYQTVLRATAPNSFLHKHKNIRVPINSLISVSDYKISISNYIIGDTNYKITGTD